MAAKRKKATRKAAVDRAARPSTLSGRYAFRFDGFARVPLNQKDTESAPYSVVGVGNIAFAHDGALGGRQRATVIAISGPGPSGGKPTTLSHSVFELKGSHTQRPDGTVIARLYFHRVHDVDTASEKVDADPYMTDVFEMVQIDGGRRLWLVSTAPAVYYDGPKKPPTPVDELVGGEGVKL